MSKFETMIQTYEHKQNVSKFISFILHDLIIRSIYHDNSKLESPEVDIFTEYTPKLANSTYGSDEYHQFLKEMKVALDSHYTNNSHHPEWEKFNLVEYRDIKGFEGIYQISNYGDVKRLAREVTRKKQGNFYVDEKIIKSHVTPKGYLRIQLSNNGKRSSHFIHRLVAEAFLPNPDNKPQVNHKDGNKTNNHVTNLEWCDNSENQIHAYENGLQEIVYVVKCIELDITTFGCGEMERKLKELGYKNARDSTILACINGNSAHHLGLHFEGYRIEEYRRSELSNMDLVDLIEMICDWKAATLRHNDGDILKSIELNQKRFGYGDELKQIFINTVDRYF